MQDEDWDEFELIRVYQWSARWMEVHYGEDDWPSRSSRWRVFEPWWWNK